MKSLLSFFGDNFFGSTLPKTIATAESYDLNTVEGCDKAIEDLESMKDEPLFKLCISLLGFDFDEIKEIIEEHKTSLAKPCDGEETCDYGETCDCGCMGDEDKTCGDEDDLLNDFLDDFIDEYDTDLEYIEQVTPNQVDTITRLAKNFVGEMEVDSSKDWTDEDRKFLVDVLKNFGAYILLA